MKKVSKAILIGLAVLLALGVALLFGLNLYVQSPGTQARIQAELGKALRLPLKLTNTSVTPWSDLRITGITIPHGDSNFLEAGSFTARYRLLPLLEGKLIITEMSVNNPKVLWIQNAEGKWKLPEPENTVATSHEPPATPAPVTPDAPAGGELPDTKHKAGKKDAKIAVIIERFEIRNAAIELLDSVRKPVAVATEVNVSHTAFSAERVEGTATIGKLIWAGGVTAENVRMPFIYAGEEWKVSDLTATLGGGTLRGSFQARSQDQHTAYQGGASFTHVDLERLIARPPGKPAQARGELTGQFDFRMDTKRPEKAEGRGQIDLRDGQFSQLDLFQSIGSALGLREFSDLRVKDGHSELRLSGDKLYVERLQLNTADLQLSSKGIVRLDKRVTLEAQLSVEDALVKQLPGMVRDSFVLAENGRRTIDFNVTGTTEKLKTNLLDKLVGQKINSQFGDLLGSLFGGDRKEDEKKKKEEEERKKAEKERKKKEKEKNKEKADAPPDAAAAPATPPNP